jgi:integrase
MTTEPTPPKRTPARRKARQLATHLRAERPDYAYLKQVFRHLREELGVEVERAPKKLPRVPTEHEIRSFYDAVWHARRGQDVVMIKTLLYTGVRLSELVRIRLADVDLDGCRIRIDQGSTPHVAAVDHRIGSRSLGTGLCVIRAAGHEANGHPCIRAVRRLNMDGLHEQT